MMVPERPVEPQQLAEVLYSDHGSLHITHVPITRHGEFLIMRYMHSMINADFLKYLFHLYPTIVGFQK